jgi:hypothetical protein
MDIAAFRAGFPEFSDATAYPDAQLTFWATLAEAQLVDTIWTTLKPTGVMLYVAHEIVIARQNVKSAAVGGSPGQSGGIVNSKTVGAVNAAYDTVSQSEKDAGWWNRTTYGMQLFRLMKIFGAGAIQL